MNMKTLPRPSPWRTVLLVLAVAAADVVLSFVSLGLSIDAGAIPEPETAGLDWARYGFAPFMAPLGAVALIWRHRFPKSVAVVTAVLGALTFSGIAFFVALFLVARRQLSGWIVAIIALSLGAEALVGIEPLSWGAALAGAVLLGAIAGWGAYRGQRARFMESRLASLKQRAEQAESERAAEAGRSRLAERTRIAREMHDTLAHRMSLVALQAAALQVVAPDVETAHAAKVIRETAHAALGELRDVLGVLHEDGTSATSPWQPVGASQGAGESAPARTAPSGIAEIAGLVNEWRHAGVRIEYSLDPALDPLPGSVSDAVSRAAYRVVQEGITNVARHAPEAAAVLTLEFQGIDPQELRVTISNGPGSDGEPALGAGVGLIGLDERIQLLGGTLDHGPTEAGFMLQASIPLTDQTGSNPAP